jgi:Malate:quinone oxidoreductase (Mqo)
VVQPSVVWIATLAAVAAALFDQVPEARLVGGPVCVAHAPKHRAVTRFQTIKPHETKGWFHHEAGALEFGTELVVAEDKSIVALLGASPGASTAAAIAINVLQRCFVHELTESCISC